MANVWIEPKKRGTPCWVKWRTRIADPTSPKGWRYDRGTSRAYYNRSEAATAAEDKRAELDGQATDARRFTGNLLPLEELLRRRTQNRVVVTGKNKSTYAKEVELNFGKMAREQEWQTTRDITAESVQAWIDRKNGVGIAKPVSQLKAFLRWVIRPPLRQPIHADVLLMEVERKRTDHMPLRLTEAEKQAIITKAYAWGLHVGAMVEHLLRFGPRPSCLMPMNVGDWDSRQKNLTMVNGKTGRRIVGGVDFSEVPDFCKLLDRVTAGRGPEEPLYLHPSGRRWKARARGGAGEFVDWYWNNISSQVPGLDPRKRGTNALKDTALSEMDEAGVSDADKQPITGHGDQASYKRYKGTNQEVQRRSLKKLRVTFKRPKVAHEPGAAGATPGAESGASRQNPGRNPGQAGQPQLTKMAGNTEDPDDG